MIRMQTIPVGVESNVREFVLTRSKKEKIINPILAMLISFLKRELLMIL
jgi:hypothetical protein